MTDTSRETQHTGKRESARLRILSAVSELLQETPRHNLNFDDVAARAGVSRRTVFNHFPTRDDILLAFWAYALDSMKLDHWPACETDLTAIPPRSFPAFDRIEGIVRAAHMTSAGQEMRLLVNDDRRAAYEGAMRSVTRDLPAEKRRAAIAVVQLLSSPNAWMSLRDYWGMDGGEAGQATAWAIDTFLNAIRAETGIEGSAGEGKGDA